MKNILKYTLIILLAGFALAACSKDDDDNQTKGEMQYNGKTYHFISSIVNDYGDYYGNGTNNLGIRLSTSDNNQIEVDVLLDTDEFSQGSKTYTYSTSHNAGTMDAFFYYIDTDESDDDGTLKSGSATISRNGNTYEILFNVTLPNNKTISGNYKETIK